MLLSAARCCMPAPMLKLILLLLVAIRSDSVGEKQLLPVVITSPADGSVISHKVEGAPRRALDLDLELSLPPPPSFERILAETKAHAPPHSTPAICTLRIAVDNGAAEVFSPVRILPNTDGRHGLWIEGHSLWSPTASSPERNLSAHAFRDTIDNRASKESPVAQGHEQEQRQRQRCYATLHNIGYGTHLVEVWLGIILELPRASLSSNKMSDTATTRQLFLPFGGAAGRQQIIVDVVPLELLTPTNIATKAASPGCVWAKALPPDADDEWETLSKDGKWAKHWDQGEKDPAMGMNDGVHRFLTHNLPQQAEGVDGDEETSAAASKSRGGGKETRPLRVAFIDETPASFPTLDGQRRLWLLQAATLPQTHFRFALLHLHFYDDDDDDDLRGPREDVINSSSLNGSWTANTAPWSHHYHGDTGHDNRRSASNVAEEVESSRAFRRALRAAHVTYTRFHLPLLQWNASAVLQRAVEEASISPPSAASSAGQEEVGATRFTSPPIDGFGALQRILSAADVVVSYHSMLRTTMDFTGRWLCPMAKRTGRYAGTSHFSRSRPCVCLQELAILPPPTRPPTGIDGFLVPSDHAAAIARQWIASLTTTPLSGSSSSSRRKGDFQAPIIVASPGTSLLEHYEGYLAHEESSPRGNSFAGRAAPRAVAVWAGRLDSDKSPQLFVRACSELYRWTQQEARREQGVRFSGADSTKVLPVLECWVVGDGPLRPALEELASRLDPEPWDSPGRKSHGGGTGDDFETEGASLPRGPHPSVVRTGATTHFLGFRSIVDDQDGHDENDDDDDDADHKDARLGLAALLRQARLGGASSLGTRSEYSSHARTNSSSSSSSSSSRTRGRGQGHYEGRGVFVSTSVFQETFGLATLDAAAAGLPLVAFGGADRGFGAGRDVLCNGWNGIVPSIPTAVAIAEAMRQVLYSEWMADSDGHKDGAAVHRVMGRRSRRLAAHRFSQERCALAYAAIYSDTLRVIRSAHNAVAYRSVSINDNSNGKSGGPEYQRSAAERAIVRTRGLSNVLAIEKEEEYTIDFDNNRAFASTDSKRSITCDIFCQRKMPEPPRRRGSGGGLGECGVPHVAVLYYRSPEQGEGTFEVGFREALRLLEAETGAMSYTDNNGSRPCNVSGRAVIHEVNLHALDRTDAASVASGACAYFERFDIIFVKSNWRYVVDEFARRFLRRCRVLRVLLVSGSYPPPSATTLREKEDANANAAAAADAPEDFLQSEDPEEDDALMAYDMHYYEVHWYAEKYLKHHPATVHAFGIDRRVMSQVSAKNQVQRKRKQRNATVEEATRGVAARGPVGAAVDGHDNVNDGDEETKEWDALFIGAFADHVGHKRPWKIGELNASAVYGNGPQAELERPFRRAAIGKQDGDAAAGVARELRSKGVTVLPPVPYAELAALMRSAGVVYVPDDVFGGGERAVLEARSLGVKVHIEPDNPKLRELLSSPIYDHAYYARQLAYGLDLLAFRAYAEQQLQQQQQQRERDN